MAARTLTQHLLDVGSDVRGAGYAHILSAVSVAVKLTAATISRGPLVLEGATATAGEDRHVRLRLRRLATGALLAQTAGIHQLAGISIAGTPRLHEVSPEGRYLLLIEPMHGMSNLADNLPVIYFAVPRVFVATSTRVAGAVPAPVRPPVLWNADAIGASR